MIKYLAYPFTPHQ